MQIEDLYLTNYKETGGLSLRSITRLPEEEAYTLAKALTEKTTSSKNRYGDYFTTYYPKRLRTEEWLYKEFLALGGKPETEHPLYFALLDSNNLHKYFGNNDQIRIPLKSIDTTHISFTPRDSMHLIDMGRTEGTVWNKDIFFKMIYESGQDAEEFIREIPGKYDNPGSYIEVQLWSDRYIQHLL